MAQRSATKPKTTRARSTGSGALNAYLQESQRPLTILAFLLPFIALHEVGSRLFHIEVGAVTLLRLLIANFGIYGRSVPAILVILTLLLWHLLARDTWRVRLNTLVGMAAESLIFALPIFAISLICQQFLPLTSLPLTTVISKQSLLSLWSLSLGAGVYEELLFRLYLCGSIGLICRYLFGATPRTSTIVAVLLSSILFSLYHYLGREPFGLFSFVFRTLAGIYFAGLFSARGFGITAGSHALYDVIVVTVAHSI